MVALGIRKLQPASLSCLRMGECLVVAMGAGAKIVCASLLRCDHFSAIRSVFDAPLACLARDGRGSGEYNSILITLVRAALHLLFLPR